MPIFNREEAQVWLSWGLLCAAAAALAFGRFWLLFLLTFAGAMIGWRASVKKDWKKKWATAAAITNSATFIGFAIGWLILARAGYV